MWLMIKPFGVYVMDNIDFSYTNLGCQLQNGEELIITTRGSYGRYYDFGTSNKSCGSKTYYISDQSKKTFYPYIILPHVGDTVILNV